MYIFHRSRAYYQHFVSYQHLSYLPTFICRHCYFCASTERYQRAFHKRPGPLFSGHDFLFLFLAYPIGPRGRCLCYKLLRLHYSTRSIHLMQLRCRCTSKGNNWFEKKSGGTIDISCYPWIDWFYGGLQFQLEHQLFPRLPRTHLRRISTILCTIFARNTIWLARACPSIWSM